VLGNRALKTKFARTSLVVHFVGSIRGGGVEREREPINGNSPPKEDQTVKDVIASEAKGGRRVMTRAISGRSWKLRDEDGVCPQSLTEKGSLEVVCGHDWIPNK
jgi:hypothetical protein